ncbi:MAG: isoaspartyl peptidase/L-asparaginase [Chitinophagaceae bacterium]
MSILSLAIHGGAGTILKEEMTPEKEAAYQSALQAALDAGYKVLESGGEATDAVLAATVELENNILFNAGRGSVFASDGGHEMDASLMQGRDLMAGSVSAVKNIRNPILLAYKVMTASDHVMLSGKGANDFAISQGIAMEPDEYFYSEFRHEQWKSVRGSDKTMLDHNSAATKDKKFGTVGAVACDVNGHIAAATSTGGMTNKQYGRVGDSPIIGAGTYANDQTCAISCTGHGEMFIRAVAAYDVSCLMEYKGLSLREAMDIVVNNRLVKINGEGGMIGVDGQGNAALLFNSAGMYRGLKNSVGVNFTAIYRDDL